MTSTSSISALRVQQDHGPAKEFIDVELLDLVRVETLGMGGFGRVELVSP